MGSGTVCRGNQRVQRGRKKYTQTPRNLQFHRMEAGEGGGWPWGGGFGGGGHGAAVGGTRTWPLNLANNRYTQQTSRGCEARNPHAWTRGGSGMLKELVIAGGGGGGKTVLRRGGGPRTNPGDSGGRGSQAAVWPGWQTEPRPGEDWSPARRAHAVQLK